jgi:hypothetical protein
MAARTRYAADNGARLEQQLEEPRSDKGPTRAVEPLLVRLGRGQHRACELKERFSGVGGA